MEVYLDHAATTPLLDGEAEYLASLLGEYGNPSSQYSMGRRNRELIEKTRSDIRKFIGANSGSVIFTSSGSANNALAVKSVSLFKHIYYSPTMHPSCIKVLNRRLDVERIRCNKQGRLQIDSILPKLEKGDYVLVEHANSEIGTIQDLASIVERVHSKGAYVYADCTGSIPTVPLDVSGLGVDAIGFSAHKIGGLKGCGAFWHKWDYKVEPIIYGEQESGKYGGTENVLGIASFDFAVNHYEYKINQCEERKTFLYNKIMHKIPDCHLIGESVDDRLPNNLYICFKGIAGEALVEMLDYDGIQVSTGSACSTGHESSTLIAIGFPAEDRGSCIRLTISGSESFKSLDYAVERLERNVRLLRERK